ncbi:MAG: M56 family metallopeptidase [Candidatus Kerfeldbacteria bacterium]|nr:M56 family metallopeptidase [Candidatus Kerfeldbacteria bacterium]
MNALNNATSLRRQYWFTLITLVLIISGLIISAAVAWYQFWPQVIIWWQQFSGTVVATCGCSSYVEFVQSPWIALSIGAGVTLVVVLISRIGYAAITIIRNTARLHNVLQQHTISTTVCQGVVVHRVDQVEPVAVTIGLWQPQVYISTGLEATLSGLELWAVLRHELSHAHHADPLQRFGLSLVQAALPFSRAVVEYLMGMRELAADADMNDDHQLRQVLMKLLSGTATQPKVAATFFSSLNVRLDRLLGRSAARPRLRWLILMAASVMVVLLTTGRVLAKQESSPALQLCLMEQPICQAIMSQPIPVNMTIVLYE